MSDTKDAGDALIRSRPVTAVRRPFHGYVTVQGRGVVAIPPEIRKRYRMDEPGSQVEITERSDGVLELRPTIAVPAGEAWFWDENWQAGERQTDKDMLAGRFQTFDGPEDFMQHLEDLTE